MTGIWRGLFAANASFIASDYGDVGNLVGFGLVSDLQVSVLQTISYVHTCSLYTYTLSYTCVYYEIGLGF